MQELLGFRLDLRRSGQAAGSSGTGLWLEGTASLGSVVALYPGLAYGPLAYRYPQHRGQLSLVCIVSSPCKLMHTGPPLIFNAACTYPPGEARDWSSGNLPFGMCRRIPNYPRIDQDNDYLIARYDGIVLDAKPWTRAAVAPDAPAALPLTRILSDPTRNEAQKPTQLDTSWQQSLEVIQNLSVPPLGIGSRVQHRMKLQIDPADGTPSGACSLRKSSLSRRRAQCDGCCFRALAGGRYVWHPFTWD